VGSSDNEIKIFAMGCEDDRLPINPAFLSLPDEEYLSSVFS
jgi:hypothetical protein